MSHKDLKDRIAKSKVRLFQKEGMLFYSTLLAQLKIDIIEDLPWLAATNGITIAFNPEKCKEISNPQLLGLIFHELLHVVYDHVNRSKIKGIDPKVWNYAGDYLINLEAVSRNFELPEKALLDRRFVGKGTKEIYDIIINEYTANESLDLFQLAPEGSTSEDAEKVLNNLIKAASQVKMMTGSWDSMPAELRRHLDKLVNPKLSWQMLLQRYMQNYAKNDYSWKKPNRRYWPDVYLPSLYTESIGKIYAFLDVSGSINQKYLDTFISEITALFNFLNPEELKIISFDTKINTIQTFYPGDNIHIEPIGGGGTDLKDVMKYIKEQSPQVAILFTDGWFNSPNLEGINNDLLWLIYGNSSFNINKGEIIHVEE